MKNTTFLKIILHNKISQYHQLDPLDHQFHSPFFFTIISDPNGSNIQGNAFSVNTSRRSNAENISA
jgi:hypothetical protein